MALGTAAFPGQTTDGLGRERAWGSHVGGALRLAVWPVCRGHSVSLERGDGHALLGQRSGLAGNGEGPGIVLEGILAKRLGPTEGNVRSHPVVRIEAAVLLLGWQWLRGSPYSVTDPKPADSTESCCPC